MPITKYYLFDENHRKLTYTLDWKIAEEHSKSGLRVTAVTEET